MKRLVALDMLRGYALVCIMLDHMPDSVLRHITLANFSVFDAAELFVLLSGFLVGMVWRKTEQSDGVRAAQWRFARRAFEVWRALVIGGILLGLLSAGLLSVGMKHTAVWNQYAVWVIDNPLGYLGTLMTLWLQPNLLDVLAVYVILIASVPILVPILRRWPVIFAMGSAVLWWFAPSLNALVPNHNSGGLLFNPFGWQMLFFAGVAMSLFQGSFMPVLLRHRDIVTFVCTAMFTFGVINGLSGNFWDAAAPLRSALRSFVGPIDKWPLDGFRFMSIVAASWLVAVPLAGVLERVALTGPGRALQQIGRGGLWSFISCVLLSIYGDALQINPVELPFLTRLTIDFATMAALWWLAVFWLDHGAPWRAARKAASRRGQGSGYH